MTETAVEAGERQLAELQGQLTEAEAAVKASAAAARDSLVNLPPGPASAPSPTATAGIGGEPARAVR